MTIESAPRQASAGGRPGSAAGPTEILSGWDCHAHLFGPYSRYPLATDRSYTPPEADIGAYLELLVRLGLGHGVLVQPSAYCDDHALLLDTLQTHRALRGVVVAGQHTRLPLNRLFDKGVRAARFSHRSGAGANFAGSASLADLVALAPRLADAGLHAELWTDCQVLPELEARLRQCPVAVVIDHMGGFDVRAGVAQPGFQRLLALLAEGRVWVKLCAYRQLLGVDEPELGPAFHKALIAANPEQLLWGSDWPHLRVQPPPATPALLQQFRRWTHDEALAGRILQGNAQRRYG